MASSDLKLVALWSGLLIVLVCILCWIGSQDGKDENLLGGEQTGCQKINEYWSYHDQACKPVPDMAGVWDELMDSPFPPRDRFIVPIPKNGDREIAVEPLERPYAGLLFEPDHLDDDLDLEISLN